MRSGIPLAVCALAGAASCGPRALPRSEPVPAPAPPAVAETTRRDALAVHMRDHYDALRIMEHHLVQGDLDTVREYAFALALDRDADGLDAWADELAAMRAAAHELGAAIGIEEAARREAALAASCGRCHLATGAGLDVEPRALPADEPSPAARMARHQWAADRLWHAMIAPSDRAWREGMDVLAVTPLPTTALTEAAPADVQREVRALGGRMQRLARQAASIGGLDARAQRYGTILAVCAACHAAVE